MSQQAMEVARIVGLGDDIEIRARMDRMEQAGDIIDDTIILPADADEMPVWRIVLIEVAGHVAGFPEASAIHGSARSGGIVAMAIDGGCGAAVSRSFSPIRPEHT